MGVKPTLLVFESMSAADDKLKEQILGLVEGPLAGEEAEVASMTLSRYKRNSTLRIFVYSGRGASLEECARLSRLIGDLIDGTDWFQNGYTLEVSSPGLDRPLVEERDFRYRTGETVRVEFVDSKRSKLTAEILSAGNSEVAFQHGEDVLRIPLSEIKRAKIVF